MTLEMCATGLLTLQVYCPVSSNSTASISRLLLSVSPSLPTVILILDGRSVSTRGESSLNQVTSGSGLPVHEQEAIVPSPSSGFFLVKVRPSTILGSTAEERGITDSKREREKIYILHNYSMYVQYTAAIKYRALWCGVSWATHCSTPVSGFH